MTESARARERLEFEAAAEAIQKGSSGKVSGDANQLLADLSASAGLQFTMGGSESKVYTHHIEDLCSLFWLASFML